MSKHDIKKFQEKIKKDGYMIEVFDENDKVVSSKYKPPLTEEERKQRNQRRDEAKAKFLSEDSIISNQLNIEIINSEIYESREELIDRFVDKHILVYRDMRDTSKMKLIAISDSMREIVKYRGQLERAYWTIHDTRKSPYIDFRSKISYEDIGGVFY